MSAVVESGGGGRGGRGGSQDFELNLAPIIDAFTVLIAFMLVSASFLSIGIMDAGISAAGAVASGSTPPAVSVSVELAQNQKITIKLSGKSTDRAELAAKDGKYDFAALSGKIAAYRQQWKDLNAVTLVSEDSVQYRDVVGVMEELRKSVPVVLLGGF